MGRGWRTAAAGLAAAACVLLLSGCATGTRVARMGVLPNDERLVTLVENGGVVRSAVIPNFRWR